LCLIFHRIKTGLYMKYIITILTIAMTTLVAKDNTTYIKVDGMQCSYSCAGKVTSVVQKMDGVKECNVDFDKGMATVVFDDQKLETKDIVEGLKNNTSFKVAELNKGQVEKQSEKL